MKTKVKVYLWELLFRFPRFIVRSLFGNKVFMRMLFPAGRPGANGLDESLSRYLGEVDGGYFIEIGGNDGISQSNTKYLELFRGWRGLLVEPEPENFRRMTMTRANRTHKVRAACVDFDFQMSEVELTSGDLMSVSLSLPLDLEDETAHIQQSQKYLKKSPKDQTFRAPARTLESLLGEVGAPVKIDFFSLDVEGAELPVLKGLNLKNWSIEFMLVESRSPAALQHYLANEGFLLVERLSGHDYLFQRAKT